MPVHGHSYRVAAAARLLCAAVAVCVAPSRGEESGGLITGRVVDRVSGLPVESANVFLASTSRGTVTDSTGRFTLSGLPPGYFSLVTSRVGYESAVQRLQVTGGDTIRRLISLRPRVVGAPEVEVVAESPEEWRRDLGDFQREFLGSDRFGGECVLSNPEVVGFRHDSTGDLLASSDSVLRVRNASLGYMLFITLSSFRWNSGTHSVDYALQIRYEGLRPSTPGDTVAWNRHRLEAYRGSVRHFLRALVAGQLDREGFYMMNEKGESLGRDARKVLLPIPGGVWQLATEEILRIDYAGETEAHRNFVRLAQGLVHLASNGTLLEQQDFLIDPASWWAGHRIGRMLPLDYVPK